MGGCGAFEQAGAMLLCNVPFLVPATTCTSYGAGPFAVDTHR